MYHTIIEWGFVITVFAIIIKFVFWLTNDDDPPRLPMSDKQKRFAKLNEEIALAAKRDGRKF